MVTLKQLRQEAIRERPEEGKVVDNKYKLVKKLGAGGYGSVWRVAGEEGEKEKALKLLGSFKSKDEYAIEALKNEFSILKDLNHPNISKIYDFGYDNIFGFYFVSEYIEGVDFLKAIEGKSYDYLENLFVQVVRALSYIHANDVCHFDVKPSNILIRDGGTPEAALIDFGVSTGDPSQATVGTLGYMAPEMILKQQPDTRADLYSIGVLLYETLTGQNPFVDLSQNKTFEKHLSFIPDPPSSVKPDVPKYFDILTSKLLQKNPADRYQSAEEVLRELVFLSPNKYDIESKETRSAYIPTEGKIVGRVNERSALKEFVDDMGKGDERQVICISGAPGTGKTRILKDFKYYVQLKGYQSVMIEGEEFLNTSLDRVTRLVSSRNESNDPAFILIDGLFELVSKSDNLRNMIESYRSQLESGLFSKFIGIVYTNEVPMENLSKFQRVVKLDNFSRDEVEEFIKTVGNPPEEHLQSIADEILNRTRGNPELVTRACVKLIEQGFITGAGGKWDKSLFDDLGIDFSSLDVHEAVEDSLTGEIESLSEEDLNILKYMAVWEDVDEYDLFKMLNTMDYSAFKHKMSDLKNRKLISTEADRKKCQFADEYVRKLVLSKLSEDDKVVLHDKIAAYLESKKETKFYFLPDYEIDKHVAYGSDVQVAHEAILRVAEYERNAGRVALAAERLLERLERETDEHKIKALTLELCSCWLRMGKYENVVNTLSDYIENSDDLRIYELLGRAFMEQRKFDKAEQTFEKACYLCGSDKITDKLVFNNYIARILMLKGKLDRSVNLFLETNELWGKLSDEEKGKVDNNELGEAFRLRGNHDAAVVRLKDEIEWFEKDRQMRKVAVRFYSLAETYRAKKDHKKAAVYFEKGISLGKKLADSALLSRLYNGYGGMLISQGNFSQAIEQLERGLSHCYRIGDMHAAAVMTLNIGRCNNDLRNFDKAKNYLQLSLHFSESDKTDVQYVDNVLCQTYLELGDVLRQEKEFETAIKYIDDAEKLALSRKDLEIYKEPIERVKKRILSKDTAA